LRKHPRSFSLSFTSPISAFGFYGTDIGDFGGQLTLALTGSNGSTSLIVPHTIGQDGSTSGSDLYFGFYDLANTYTGISFTNNSVTDNFAFDDFSIGSLSQVTPITGGVPEPSTWAMMILGFVGAGAMM
jgi:PEP-CTERM motif-containing protein